MAKSKPSFAQRKRPNKKIAQQAVVKTQTAAAITIPWKNLFWLTAAALFIGCSLIAAIKLPNMLPVKHISIQGEFHASQAEQIRTALLPHMQGNLFFVDLAAGQQAVQQLPWVRAVQLKRRWPNRILVGITEQIAVAHWNDSLFINDIGEVFSGADSDALTALPKLSGPKGQAELVLQQYHQLQSTLDGYFLINELHLDNRLDWRLHTVHGITIKLGKQEKMLPRLERLLATMEPHLASRINNIKSIDLRYSNGFAIAWTHTPTAQPSLESNQDV